MSRKHFSSDEKYRKKIGRFCHWISKRRRYAIYLRDGFRCLACNADLRHYPPSEIGLDHLQPRSKNGKHSASNLVTNCQRCNSRRGDRPWRQFYSPAQQIVVDRKRRQALDYERAKKYLQTPRQLELFDGRPRAQMELRF